MALSVYIHVPFCKSKCIYCDFYSVTELASSEAYCDALLQEIRHYSKDERIRDRSIGTIFFGGGTPSLLDADEIDRILGELNTQFGILPSAEITLEANPDDISDQLAERWRDTGINRVSIGVQSLRDTELRFLRRRHTSAAAVNSILLLRQHGFGNISLDLLYGLPGMTPESWRETLLQAMDLRPEHLSAYCLTVETGTHLYQMIRRREAHLPDDDLLREMYLLTVDETSRCGYRQYEISNFALEGSECRHNLAYWTGRPYLGLGAAAASYFHPTRWKNVSDVELYMSEVDRACTAVDEAETLDFDTIRSEYVMLSLRLTRGLDCVDYENRFGDSIRVARALVIDALVEDGMMISRDGFLRLTPEGMFMSDEIISLLT